MSTINYNFTHSPAVESVSAIYCLLAHGVFCKCSTENFHNIKFTFKFLNKSVHPLYHIVGLFSLVMTNISMQKSVFIDIMHARIYFGNISRNQD